MAPSSGGPQGLLPPRVAPLCAFALRIRRCDTPICATDSKGVNLSIVCERGGMVDALSSGGSECMLVGVQLPPLARAEKGWNPTIPALLLYPKRMKCDKKVLKCAESPAISAETDKRTSKPKTSTTNVRFSRKHNPNNQFGRIEHIATQNHTSRDRLEKQIRNALQTNPMRPILKKNEIRRTTFPRTQSQAFPGISL